MATNLDIANEALHALQAQKITSLTATGKIPEALNDALPRVRLDVLRMHDWTCARKRAPLTERTEESAGVDVINYSGRDHVYDIPDDKVRLIEVVDVNQQPVQFIVEGQRIYTDDEEPYIIYTFDQDDPTYWDDLLRSTVALMLAARVALEVTGDPSYEEKTLQKAGMYLQQARRQSAREARQGAAKTDPWYPGIWTEDKR